MEIAVAAAPSAAPEAVVASLPNKTIYVNNLNEKIGKDLLKVRASKIQKCYTLALTRTFRLVVDLLDFGHCMNIEILVCDVFTVRENY